MAFEPKLCDCGGAFMRRVLAEERLHGAGQRVMACVRCGAARAVRDRLEPIPYDPRDASAVTGYDEIPLSGEALAWLVSWPRLVPVAAGQYWHAHNSFYLSAALRVKDEAELSVAESAAATSGLGYEARLRAAGVPASPPPDGTEKMFGFVTRAWDALQLSAETSVETLLSRIRLGNDPESWLAIGRLPERAALADAMAAFIAGENAAARESALSSLKLLRPTPTSSLELPSVVLDALAKRLRELAGEEPIGERRKVLRWLQEERDKPDRDALYALLGAEAEALFDTDPFAPHRAGKPFR
jgi:hypothetical protein